MYIYIYIYRSACKQQQMQADRNSYRCSSSSLMEEPSSTFSMKCTAYGQADVPDDIWLPNIRRTILHRLRQANRTKCIRVGQVPANIAVRVSNSCRWSMKHRKLAWMS